jgi:hypothetical protein
MQNDAIRICVRQRQCPSRVAAGGAGVPAGTIALGKHADLDAITHPILPLFAKCNNAFENWRPAGHTESSIAIHCISLQTLL